MVKHNAALLHTPGRMVPSSGAVITCGVSPPLGSTYIQCIQYSTAQHGGMYTSVQVMAGGMSPPLGSRVIVLISSNTTTATVVAAASVIDHLEKHVHGPHLGDLWDTTHITYVAMLLLSYAHLTHHCTYQYVQDIHWYITIYMHTYYILLL